MTSRNRSLLASALVVLVVIVVLPIGMIVYGALQDASPTRGATNWSLDSMRHAFGSQAVLTPLRNSLLLAVAVTMMAVFLGGLFAWIIARTDVPGRRMLSVMIVAPLFLSPLTAALAWVILGAPDVGLINVASKTVTGRDLINVFSVPGIALIMAFQFVPFAYLAISSMLANMDGGMEESARSLGAGTFNIARKITLPLAAPAAAASSMLIFILSIEMFSIPSLLGRPIHFETLMYTVYRSVRLSPARWNDAAATGLIVLVIAGVVLLVQKKWLRSSQEYTVFGGRAYTPSRVGLGRFRPVIATTIIAYCAVCVALPAVALIFGSLLTFTTSRFDRMIFTVQNYGGLGSNMVFTAVKNTLMLSVLVPTILVLFSLVVAYLHRHQGGEWQTVLRGLSTAPIAVPGVVLGVGMLWLYFRIPLPIYGTILALLLAYMTKLLPHGVNIIMPALSQIDTSLEESARGLGAKTGLVLRRIIAPLAIPSMVSAWLLIFVLSARELNASIMLYSPRSRVYEVLIWDLAESGRSNGAYALAVLQMITLGIVAAVALNRTSIGASQRD